jgi:hypothetical protein
MGAFVGEESMTHYLAQDFARCASNRIKIECDSCLRNMHISPVHPQARQVWIGPWVLDEPCPSRVPKEADK